MVEKLKAYYGLPREVKFCRRCVISNQRPSSAVEFKHNSKTKKETIHFDEEGICDACRVAERKEKEIDWKKREEELRKLCDKYRRNDGRYDCIVPGSGGKDSVKAAWLLKYKYNMHPLTVTWAPHLYTSYGWNNFVNWAHKGGFDNILFTPNGKVHRLLSRLAFDNLLYPFQPFLFGQKNIGPIFAIKYNVPLVFYGENEAEYGNPIKDTDIALRSSKFHTTENYEDLSLGGISVKDLIKKYGLTMNDLLPYLPLNPKELKEKNIQVHYLGYYETEKRVRYYSVVNDGRVVSDNKHTYGGYKPFYRSIVAAPVNDGEFRGI